jgi:hypothetical protein
MSGHPSTAHNQQPARLVAEFTRRRDQDRVRGASLVDHAVAVNGQVCHRALQHLLRHQPRRSQLVETPDGRDDRRRKAAANRRCPGLDAGPDAPRDGRGFRRISELREERPQRGFGGGVHVEPGAHVHHRHEQPAVA